MPLSANRKIHYIQLLFLSLIIVATALVLRPLLVYTEKRMDEVKNGLISSLENVIDYNISYSSISPSVFSYISINDLTIYGDGGRNDILAEIKSLKAFYSPFYFFNRDNIRTPLQAVERFTINQATVNFDDSRDQSVIEFFSGQADSRIAILPLTTRFNGRNIDVKISTAVGELVAEDLFISLIPEENAYRTRIDGDLNILVSDETSPVKWASAAFRARGSISEYFESINFTVGTENFRSDIVDISDQTFQFISTAEGIELRKVQDNSPIDLALRYDGELDDLVFTFNAEKFRPDSIVRLKGELSEFNPYVASEITGNGSLLFNNKRSAIVYSLSADVDLNRNIFDRFIFLRADLAGDLSRINVRSFDFRTVEGRAVFSGEIDTENFFPKGRLRLVNIKTPNGFTLNSRIDVDNDEGFLHFRSDALSLGARDLENFNLVIFPDEDSVTASMKASLPGDGNRNGFITVDSIVTLDERTTVDSFISLEKLPADSIYSLLPIEGSLPILPDELLNTSLSSELYVQTDLEAISLSVNSFELVSDTEVENKLTFSASYDERGFKFNDLYLNWDEYDLNGYINSTMNEGEYRISTHFDFEDKPYHLQAFYSDDQFLIEGDYELYGFVQKTADGSFAYRFSSSELPVPIEGYTLLADLNASGHLDGSDWNLFLDNTKIKTPKFMTLTSPELEITADFDRNGADIYELIFRDDNSSLKGLGRLSYFPGEINSWISLLDESGRTDEQYDLFFSMIDKEIESRLSIVSTPLERFQETGLTGNLSLDLVFNGTTENPDYQAVIETDQMNVNGVPVVISTFLRGDRERLRISDLELEYNGIMLNRGLVMVELDEGKLLATGAVNQIINRSRASTSLSAVIKINESLDFFSLAKLKDGDMEGKLTVAPITWDGLKTFPRLDVDLDKQGPLISGTIDNGKILASTYNIDNGDLWVSIRDLFPLRLDARGRIFESNVDMEIDNLVFDPSFLNYLMPTDPFEDQRAVIFTSGDITGDFTISGPLTDPDYNGELQVNELVAASPFLAEIPEPLSTKATMEGKSLVLDPFSIILDKGSIDVESSFQFDGGLPTIYDVDVEMTGSAGARIAYAIPGFSWDGHFTGFTHIEGNRNGGFLKGDLICNDLVSSLESDAVFNPDPVRPVNPSVNGFTVDLTVQTGRDVNFYLPNRQVPIIQATADNGDNINIAYDSRSDELALRGRVDIRTGEINYFNKTFYLQEGFIDFDESQVKFNPRLNVRADVISKDELGEDVTISLLFDDYLMNEFQPEFLSFPRKTENEILALLGQSFIPSNDPDQVSVASLIVATGGMIGKNTILQPFEEALKTSLDLDFVSFNTNIIENAILDRFQDQDLYAQGGQEMNFARYLEDTSLFVGEYIGDFLFLEGSLVVDYDESHSVSSTFGGLELNVNLNLQLITPFVLIDWSYDPKNNPGSDYFFPQNTISFTWQYSY